MLRAFVAFFAAASLLVGPSVSPLPGAKKEEGLSKKEQKKRLKKLQKELRGPFKKWLKQDVTYIITPEERKAFLRLETDGEREQFIQQFWLRRDPTPDTVENEYKEEHYRRIAYANERFASGIPGWKTDRGRIYITFGPPDEIESHPSGGLYQRPFDEGGGTTSTYPFEKWRYRYLECCGTNVIIEFVDPTMTGEYRLTTDPSDKDALLHVPNAGLTLAEQLGISSKVDRFTRTDGTNLGAPPGGATSMRLNQFERLQLYANLHKPPEVKFKDLEAAVNSNIEYNTLPVRYGIHYTRVTNNSVLTGISVQLENKDLMFKEEDGLQKAIVNIFGRISTVTRRVATVFEDVVTVDTTPERIEFAAQRSSIYQKSVPLAPGMYRLELIVKDVVGETMSTHRTALRVPEFDSESLSASSLIIADRIERVPTRSLGTGQFVIGSSKVRPRIGEEFKPSERMGIYLQVYNLGEDEATQRPQGAVTYQIAKLDQPGELLLNFTEPIDQIRGASSRQMVIEKLLPLNSLSPGEYQLKLKIADDVKNETITESRVFKVKQEEKL